MRILMLGAGGVGGYFGGRMVQAGSDVTFLVREARAVQLQSGLQIESPRGNANISVKCITTNDNEKSFDVIILSCKAYGLAGALDAIVPFIAEGVPVLPLLNGFGHVELIEQRFPPAVVWGGIAGIFAMLTQDGVVRQTHPNQVIALGVRQGQSDSQGLLDALTVEMRRAEIDAVASPDIELAMWEKWTFLATLAASTCLMRGSIGEILATDYGEQLIAQLFDECQQTAAAEGWPAGPNPAQDYRALLFDPNGTYTASMLRDMDSGGPTEADHILGNMISRAHRNGIEAPMLEVAYSRLQVHERQRTSPKPSTGSR